MKCRIMAFGITKDILGQRELTVEIKSGNTVGDLKRELEARFTDLKSLNSLFIAVNQSYAEESSILHESDEIALIPPVNGG